jgi:zinc/manganese transport system substrate-binding protein
MKMRTFLVLGALAGPLCAAAWAPAARADVNVFACEPEWAALAKEIGGDHVSTFSATAGKQDPHSIQARPGLIARVHRADLVFCTGVELEAGWLPLLIINASNAGVQPGTPGYLLAGDLVRLMDVNPRADRSEGDVHAMGNHHIVTDPRNIAIVSRALLQRLVLLDAADAPYFERRHQDFAKRWADAIQRWQERAEPLKGVAVVVHHRTWTYLFDWLGIREVASLEPKPGIPPSTSHLNAVMAILRSQPAKMVVHAAFEDSRPSEYVSRQMGIPAVALPYTIGGSDNATDLFSLFDDTIERLLLGLQGKTAARR